MREREKECGKRNQKYGLLCMRVYSFMIYGWPICHFLPRHYKTTTQHHNETCSKLRASGYCRRRRFFLFRRLTTYNYPKRHTHIG